MWLVRLHVMLLYVVVVLLLCCLVVLRALVHTRNNKIVQHACIMLWISLWITFIVILLGLWIKGWLVVDRLTKHVFARFTQVKHVREHVFFICKNAYKLYAFQTLLQIF